MSITEQEKVKIEKLPLWAKQLISKLRGKIQRQEKELLMLKGLPTKISDGNKGLDKSEFNPFAEMMK